MNKKELLILLGCAVLAIVIGLVFIKKNQKVIEVKPLPLGNSSCIQSGSRAESPFDVAYCALAGGENLPQDEFIEAYEKSSAIFPELCGAKVKSTCGIGGRMEGTYPLYKECVQFCLHPETGKPLPAGSTYHYFTASSGSLGRCQEARKVATCGASGKFEPEIPYKKFQVCSVINPNIGTIEFWSDPITWGGKLPETGDEVTIPKDKTIIMDINPPALKSLSIIGTLAFDNQNLLLVTRSLYIAGNLRIGSPKAAFKHKASVVLTKGNSKETYSHPQGIRLQGGKLYLFGNKIDRSAAAAIKVPTGLTRMPYENWGMTAFDNILIMTEN